MLPGQVEITETLGLVAKNQVRLYRAALRFHFGLWRWQGISDQPSLSFLRRVLLENALVEPSPDPGWIVNRGAGEYRQHFGPSYEDFLNKLTRETLTGHVPIDAPQRAYDSGSGSNTAAYERTRPGMLSSGSGLSLVFAVDGTLRNWLREPLRAPRIARYKSDLAGSTLKGVEILCVARFASNNTDEGTFDPIFMLENARSEDAAIPAATLYSVERLTKETLEQMQFSETDNLIVLTTWARLLTGCIG